MIHSRLTSKSQTTVPQGVRRALGIGPGDTLGWRIESDCVVLTRSSENNDGFVNNFSTFTEWTDEYDRAYDDL